RTLVALDFVGNLLVFVEAAQAGLFNGGDVHEHVLAAVVGLDEAVALGGVEPFHGAGSHYRPPFGVGRREHPWRPVGSERSGWTSLRKQRVAFRSKIDGEIMTGQRGEIKPER